jgi:hypothetical protein
MTITGNPEQLWEESATIALEYIKEITCWY